MQQFIDNWSATLLAAISAADVTISVAPAQAARLVGLGGGNTYHLTLVEVDASGIEIGWDVVVVTAVAGGTLTVTRTGTARSWPTGSTLEARITAAALVALQPSSAAVLATVLEGLSLATAAPVDATDSLLVSIGKLQAQLSTSRAVLTESGTSRTLGTADAGAYIRHTNAVASVVVVAPQADQAWAGGAEVHLRRAAAGNLTLSPGAGVTLNAPAGGTLVMTDGMTATLKRVGENVWDVIGQTVPT